MGYVLNKNHSLLKSYELDLPVESLLKMVASEKKKNFTVSSALF
jgi:hypothetical protein